MPSDKRKIGRPGRKPNEGERVGLSLRVTPETKRTLDAAAEKAGRSLSQEAEYRLERSFQNEQLLPQLLDMAYGRQLAGLLIALGRSMRDAGWFVGMQSNEPFSGWGDWFSSPVAYGAAVVAAKEVLHGFGSEDDLDAEVVRLGRELAARILEALRNPGPGGEIGDWAKPVRELLGPAAERIRAPEGSER